MHHGELVVLHVEIYSDITRRRLYEAEPLVSHSEIRGYAPGMLIFYGKLNLPVTLVTTSAFNWPFRVGHM